MRFPTVYIGHFDLAPHNPPPPSGSQGLHYRFLGREACRESVVTIPVALAIGDFHGREQSQKKPLPVALDRLADARNLGNVNAQPENHDASILTDIAAER
jgi:hypothetical protein